MKKDKSRIEFAQNIALEEGLDYILEVSDCMKDFVEVVGKMGGDTVTYHIYNDGSIYER